MFIDRFMLSDNMANFFQKMARLPKLLMDLGMLQADVEEAQHDPELLAELDKCPLLKARIEAVSAEWRSVAQDIESIKH